MFTVLQLFTKVSKFAHMPVKTVQTYKYVFLFCCYSDKFAGWI